MGFSRFYLKSVGHDEAGRKRVLTRSMDDEASIFFLSVDLATTHPISESHPRRNPRPSQQQRQAKAYMPDWMKFMPTNPELGFRAYMSD